MSLFNNNILAGASGAAGAAGEATYVDDVFSTFLYDGANSGTTTITNGLDLDGEGGLVWLKSRTNAADHALISSDNSFTGWLSSNDADARAGTVAYVTGNSDGFTLNNGGLFFNDGGQEYASWSFRKAPGFFDVVTWTGNGTNRTISHNLGSTPGFIIVKRYSNTEDWTCWHRSVGATKYLQLNGTGSAADLAAFMNNTEPTSTEFTVGTHDRVNTDGETYIAYIFAHDDQSFGTDSDEAVIKCGKWTGNATNPNEVDLGFEPQWLMMKRTGGTGDWYMFDDMRGWGLNDRNYLEANTSDAEAGPGYIVPTATGFKVIATGTNWNANNEDYIYVAIRRPNKPPTDADDVFAVSAAAGNSNITTNFPVDLAFQLRRSAGSRAALTRLQGKATLETRNTSAETVNANAWYESNTKFLNAGLFSADSAFHLFKRAPGFMDVVGYTGTGAATISHNLAQRQS